MTKAGKKRKKRIPSNLCASTAFCVLAFFWSLPFVTGFEIELLLEVSKLVI